MACRAARQEFQYSQFLCLQPTLAEFGGAFEIARILQVSPKDLI